MLITVIWLSAVEAAVLSTVAWLVTEDTPVETEVMADFTLDMPTVAVDSELDRISQVLFSIETFAWVDVRVVVDCALESTVASDVTPESRVLSEVAADSAALSCVEIDAASEPRVEVLTEADRPVDRVVDRRVLMLASIDTLDDTTLDTEVSADRAAEIEPLSEVAAEVIADVDTTLLMITNELKKDEFCVPATVSWLAIVDSWVDVVVSIDAIELMPVCRATICESAVLAAVETLFWKLMTAETPVFAVTMLDRTVLEPVTVVDSDVLRLVKALRPEETCALVGEAASATMLEIAVEKRTASDVVPLRLVLSSVAAESADDTIEDTDVGELSAPEVMADRLVCVDSATETDVEREVSAEAPEETFVVRTPSLTNTVDRVVETDVRPEFVFDTEAVIVRFPGSAAFSTLAVG